MPDQNEQLADRIMEIFNSGDTSELAEVVADDFVEHNPLPGMGADRDALAGLITALHGGFSDFKIEVKLRISAGDYLVEHWVSGGTHDGDFLGIPASGNEVSIEGIDINRIEDGKLAEHWGQMDSLGLMQQLGVIPAEEGATA